MLRMCIRTYLLLPSVSTVRAPTFRLPSRSRCLLSVVRRLPTWCLLSVIRAIYSVYTFGVYFACSYFPSRSRCLLSMVRITDSVSTFYGLYYLRGVYFRCLLCALLLSVFRRARGVYFRWSVDYLLGVYFLRSVLSSAFYGFPRLRSFIVVSHCVYI